MTNKENGLWSLYELIELVAVKISGTCSFANNFKCKILRNFVIATVPILLNA